MGNGHGQEDAAPGSVGTAPWSWHPSSASSAGNGHLQAESGVSRGERLWRHHPPTLRPGPMGMRKETPRCPQPEGTHSCPSLADAHSGISPTAQPSSTLVLPTTGEPAPNPQENLFQGLKVSGTAEISLVTQTSGIIYCMGMVHWGLPLAIPTAGTG